MIGSNITSKLEAHYRETSQTDLLLQQMNSNRITEVVRVLVNSCDYTEGNAPLPNRHIQFIRPGDADSIEARIIAKTAVGLGEVLSNVPGKDILVNKSYYNYIFGPSSLTSYNSDEQDAILASLNTRTVGINKDSSGHTHILISLLGNQ